MNRLLARSESHFMGMTLAQQEMDPLIINESASEPPLPSTPRSVVAANSQAAPQRKGLKNLLYKLQLVDSRERHHWLLLQLLSIAYICLTWPVELCFEAVWASFPYFVVFDSLADLIFLSDVLLRFAFDANRAILKDVWFWVDVVALIPADLFVWDPIWLHFLLRINRLLRLAEARGYAFEFQRYSVRSTFILFMTLAVVLFFISNAFACAYVGLSFVQNYETPWGLQKTFAGSSFWVLYYEGFCWAWQVITRTGGSFSGPTTFAEKGLTIFLGLVVLFVGAAVVGEIAGLITMAQLKQSKLSAKLRAVSDFATSRKLPRSLSHRLIYEINSHWSATHDQEEIGNVLQDVSKESRANVAVYLHRDVLRRVSMFSTLPHELLREIASSLKSHTFPANETVVREGEPGGAMYFVDSGMLEVCRSSVELGGAASVYSGAKSKNRIGVLSEGDFFGEGSMLDPKAERSATVRTLSTCRLFELKGSKLLALLARFPAALDSIYRIANQRVGQEHLRAIFHGFEEALLPHMSLVRLSAGNVLAPSKMYFSISGAFDVQDEQRRSICAIKESIFFGHASSEHISEYRVVVSSQDAFCFVLEDPSSIPEEDLALLRAHEHDKAYFIKLGELARQSSVDLFSALMGETVSIQQLDLMRRNEFGAKLLDLVSAYSTTAMLGRSETSLTIKFLNKLQSNLIDKALK